MRHQFILIFSLLLLYSCKGDKLISSLDVNSDGGYPKTGETWGFINSQGDVTIPMRYEEVRDFHEGLAAFRKGYLWGYLDSTGQEKIKPNYIQAHSFSDHLAQVVNAEGKTIFIDAGGKSAFAVFCNKAGNFNNNRAPIWQNNKVGFINNKGKVVISPKFDDAYGFRKKLAIVKQNKKYGIIDIYGQYILEPKYDFIYQDPAGTDPIFLVQNKTTRYFNAKIGKFLKPKFDDGKPFYDTYAVAKKDSLFGVINTKGNWVLMPMFQDLINLGEKRWALQYEQEYFMIDSTGLQQGEGFKQLYRFSEGLAIAQIDRKWGYVDSSGQFVIQPIYELVWPFKNGVARVVTEDGVAFINKTGSFIIKPIRGNVLDFREGLARLNVPED